jgi:hypothetical protein
MNASRRQFVHGIGILGALFLGRGLIACAAPSNGEATGETNDSLDSLTTCGGDAVIGHNHGHALQVPAEDVAAGAEKTYSIKGAAGHDHQVTLTAEHFASLAAGGSITVTSSTVVGHAHPVTVTCAATTNTDAGAVCPNGATATAISANHGHTLVVPTADVAVAVAKTYSIKGTATHNHDVTLTPDHFAQLAAGATISVTSTTVGSHAHVVKVICA